ncbi:MAG: TIGR04282 family arsenosugar biosynthesis glycosyltransferase [Sedimentisphaerales bacterium]|nr:TIGR04282 family arsenosugar biosynthesis glycosyltransferase [Sedimentisphaerales bacterium]
MNHNNCLLLFVKSPIKGQVKTRLAAETGGDFALELYKCFVEDIISLAENLDVHLVVCFCPADRKMTFSEWLGEQHCYRAQMGNNLGEKLRNAFENAFEEGFANVVAIGSDSPDLPEEFLQLAFKELESHDAVIGPGSDGGYYLIGFSRTSFLPVAFDDIAWSTFAVCKQTVDILKKHKLKMHLLPEWHDVDTRSDLEKLIARNKDTAFVQSKTAAFFRKMEKGKLD